MAEEQKVEQEFQIQRVFLKDLSFEAPLGADAFLKQYQPSVNQELATETRKIDDTHFEVVLKLTITATADDKTVFLVEIQQAGIFYMTGIHETNLPRVLNTVCPQVLFPYARETIDSVLSKGTYPALMLAPINFDALFAQAQANKDEAAKH